MPPKPPEIEVHKPFLPHYLTFPTTPPKSRGRPPVSSTNSSFLDGVASGNYGETEDPANYASLPLPKGQLVTLAIMSLAEQTAFNSFSPYLPEMIAGFPGIDQCQSGLYVGIVASCFALAQCATNFFWGWLSDRVGRKPVILLGTLLSALCFVVFGFCQTLWQAILVQVMMGLVNGNQGVISTCLGEITNKNNQSRAFTYLPVVYGIGGITGPALGGLMVLYENPFRPGQRSVYPYLLPNIFSAFILGIDMVIICLFLRETLDDRSRIALPFKERATKSLSWLRVRKNRMQSSLDPAHSYSSAARYQEDLSEDVDNSSIDRENFSRNNHPTLKLIHSHHAELTKFQIKKQFLNRDILFLLASYFGFQLSNVSYNSLYPIFASSLEPDGRNLSVKEIGLSIAFSGLIAIVFQIGIFGKLKARLGNKNTFRAGLLLLSTAMMLTPWVGYRNSSPPIHWGTGATWLWIELGLVLFLKTFAAVGGLSSALLLITNSPPDNSLLGTLNGLAQTLSSAGRALGPLLSGGLFSLATSRRQHGGEVIAWSVLGTLALLSFLASSGIHGSRLESDDGPGEGADPLLNTTDSDHDEYPTNR
ncbi:Bgt-4499 [Blumeria graminis f. sp. tritici]|uniref:Bgt-4499 n=2 Tax=Blumeria graminis f. sp. tritici TaxID=62690 RepID=A0A0P0FU57_BLUGR|nr:Bgt-4499 [Blumeria graminis f. sp. tritici]EPQ62948.1 hypothetical protein BGT96224_4499 [Blumeria graminis f. sp. tritici 96224]VDB87749.1 Bgt-4499 [Blumeria graminis f. sp. tritici]